MRKLVHSPNHSQLTVRQTAHSVIGMHPDTSPSIHCFFSFVKGCIGVTKRNRYPFSCYCADKVFYTISLRSKGNFIEQAVGCFLPCTEFIHSRIFHVGWILCPFVLLCKVRSFKVNTTNLSTRRFLVSCSNVFSDC